MAAGLEDRRNHLEDSAANVSKSPRKKKQWVDTPQHIGVTLVNHIGWKAEEILDSLVTVLNEGRDAPIIKYLMLYKQLFVSVVECAGPICVFATRPYVDKRQVVEEMDLAIGRSHFLCC
jgi:hypothetical protein